MENDDEGNSLFCLKGMENGEGNLIAHTSVAGPTGKSIGGR